MKFIWCSSIRSQEWGGLKINDDSITLLSFHTLSYQSILEGSMWPYLIKKVVNNLCLSRFHSYNQICVWNHHIRPPFVLACKSISFVTIIIAINIIPVCCYFLPFVHNWFKFFLGLYCGMSNKIFIVLYFNQEQYIWIFLICSNCGFLDLMIS